MHAHIFSFACGEWFHTSDDLGDKPVQFSSYNSDVQVTPNPNQSKNSDVQVTPDPNQSKKLG
jgi:hypothetical protein